jgi:head-tail adaptor
MGFSTFLNGAAPTQLRGLAWLSLSDSGILQSLAGTSDAGGGITSAWSNVGTTECRIDPLTARSRITGGQIDERSTHVVTVPPDVVVSGAQRFAITNRGTYEVTAVHDRTEPWLNTFEVIQIS